MPENKVQFGRPDRRPGDDTPPHLPDRPKITTILQNATIEDFAWVGEDAQLDTQQFLDEALSPPKLLCEVLRAVIEAHPNDNEHREKRLNVSMKSLIGQPPKPGRPKTAAYDHALKFMVDRYISGYFGFEPPARSLNELANQALRSTGEYPDDPETLHSRLKKLREDFEKEKDRLLAVRTGDDYLLHATKKKVAAALQALADLGIAVGPPGANPIK